MSGHQSTAGRAHDRESAPAKDRRYTDVLQPTNRLSKLLQIKLGSKFLTDISKDATAPET